MIDLVLPHGRGEAYHVYVYDGARVYNRGSGVHTSGWYTCS